MLCSFGRDKIYLYKRKFIILQFHALCPVSWPSQAGHSSAIPHAPLELDSTRWLHSGNLHWPPLDRSYHACTHRHAHCGCARSRMTESWWRGWGSQQRSGPRRAYTAVAEFGQASSDPQPGYICSGRGRRCRGWRRAGMLLPNFVIERFCEERVEDRSRWIRE